MGKLRLKGIIAALLAFMAGGPAFAQSAAQYYQYNTASSGNGYYMPQQASAYQQPSAVPSPYYSAPPIKVVDYNRQPVMNAQTYQDASGYKSPNTYSLVSAAQRKIGADGLYRDEDDQSVKYYMSLSYGQASFDGKGIMNDYYEYAMSNVSSSMGDGRNIGIGFGTLAYTGLRVELGFSQISGLKYGEVKTSLNQWCPADRLLDVPPTDPEYGAFFYDCSKEIYASGGGISSQNFGLNAYFPISDLTGDILDGMIRPYIGGGLGMAFNTLDDYTVTDAVGYGEPPLDTTGALYVGGQYSPGIYEYNGLINHFGATTSNVSWNVEIGATIEVSAKTKLDLYYRKSNYGKIKSKGEAFSNYEAVEILDPLPSTTTCSPDAVSLGFNYFPDTGWCENYLGLSDARLSGVTESGTIENTEFGAKLRMIF
ncbi:MAG: hypothetical protein LBI17_03690 [Rickettsiales bacterium]|jgi:opacity protein-like surface antigen|nr:hypothetical protein [Rickettsiales bacterium]